LLEAFGSNPPHAVLGDPMRPYHLPVALLFALTILAQDVSLPILTSHDAVVGPGGEPYVGDLRVFESGKVVYVEDGKEHSTTVSADEIRALRQLLQTPELRSVPEKLSSPGFDFLWHKSLQINLPDKTQRIEIENFYPFLNLEQDAYPEALIRLQCQLEHLQATAANRGDEKAGSDWCRALLNKNKSRADCKQVPQEKIIAGEGWGPVRIGAAYEDVEAFLGEGRATKRYSGVHFEDYEEKGLQVSFDNDSNSVHAIYFYNGQRNDPQFSAFCGQVEKHVNWESSIDDVRKAFGKPAKEFSGTYSGVSWTRLVFDGIDFRFENGKMVRIGVPGN
jgi:hypothetical protein